MADVFTVNGVTLDLTTDDYLPTRYSERFGTIPCLTLTRRGVALGPLPEPWMAKEVTWTKEGTLRFRGNVVSVSPHYTGIGWVLSYQCLGLKNRLDWFPHTDANTGTDTSAWNLPLDDPYYDATKASRSVGQIFRAILEMQDNADAVDAHGMGAYASLSPPTLPADTLADLAAMTIVPQRPVYFTAEKFGNGLDGLTSQYAPNYRFWVDPTGKFRWKDLRTFPATTLTMGTDPILPTELSRDIGDCFQRVVGRGQPIAIMAFLKLSLGQITEQFTWGAYGTNAAAKAAWTTADFLAPGTAQDHGTCVCTSTNTLTLTSSSGSTFWAANYWDQSHQKGTLNVSSTVITNYTQFWSGRITVCAALSAGGSAAVTIDNPMPHTSFDKYTITGLAAGGSVVWNQYQIANTDLWPRVVKQATYPQPFVNPGGGVTLISTPMGAVFKGLNIVPLSFTYTPSNGMIRFIAPTWVMANNSAPDDVWVAIPVQTNPNTAVWPPDSGGPVYGGTSYTVDGDTKTLTVQLDFWRDPAQSAQVLAYLEDIHDSVKDAVVEGTVTYFGDFPAALDFGMALAIAGNDGAGAYDTLGWDGMVLPVIGVDLEWPQDEGMDLKTTVQVSNRKAHLSAEMFMHPERQFLPFGSEVDPFSMEDKKVGIGSSVYDTQAGTSWTGEHMTTPEDTMRSSLPGPVSIPTSPGEYMQQQGLARSPGEFMEQQGLARSPGEFMEQQGLSRSPGEFMEQQGLARSPGEFMGQQGLPTGGAPDDMGAQPAGRIASPPPAPAADAPAGAAAAPVQPPSILSMDPAAIERQARQQEFQKEKIAEQTAKEDAARPEREADRDLAIGTRGQTEERQSLDQQAEQKAAIDRQTDAEKTRRDAGTEAAREARNEQNRDAVDRQRKIEEGG